MHICTKDRINQCNGNFDIMISITNGEQINTEKIYYDYLGKRNHVELKGNRNVGKIEVKITNFYMLLIFICYYILKQYTLI